MPSTLICGVQRTLAHMSMFARMGGRHNHNTIFGSGSFASTLLKSAFVGRQLPDCSLSGRAW
ncbi:hypothetical protein WOC76_21560 [Methylocystis sp. IM3]|uniref:hypothetical protein n=1 Tax=unclassified Methylocystis TaxID=2625913 RepID=UPI0030FBAA0E